jgi:hypothetical protein
MVAQRQQHALLDLAYQQRPRGVTVPRLVGAEHLR